MYILGPVYFVLILISGFLMVEVPEYGLYPALFGAVSMLLFYLSEYRRLGRSLTLFWFWIAVIIFFYLEPANPFGSNYLIWMGKLVSDQAVFLAMVIPGIGCLMISILVPVWSRAFERYCRTWVPVGIEAKQSFHKVLFIGFLASFSFLAFIFFTFGGGISVLIQRIVHMRSGGGDAGFTEVSGAIGVLGPLVYGLIGLPLFLISFRGTRFHRFAIGASFLVVPLAVGMSFSGTRTYLGMFLLPFAIYLSTGLRRFKPHRVILLGFAATLLYVFIQVAGYYRKTGLSEFDFDSFSKDVLVVRGFQTYSDQMLSLGFVERYGIGGNEIVSIPLGMLTRPFDIVSMYIPRAIWRSKPLFEELNAFALYYYEIHTGKVPKIQTDYSGRGSSIGFTATPGLFGGEIIRFGPWGALITVVVYSAVLGLSEWSMLQRKHFEVFFFFGIALLTICLAWFRHVTGVWTVPMIGYIVPFLVAMIVTRFQYGSVKNAVRFGVRRPVSRRQPSN